MAKADHVDASKQFRLAEEGELSTVATLQNPRDQRLCGWKPKAQLSGSTVAVLRNNFLSRVIATLACRFLKITCVGFLGDSGIEAPWPQWRVALDFFASFNELLHITLKEKKSETWPSLTFPGLSIGFKPRSCRELVLSQKRTRN